MLQYIPTILAAAALIATLLRTAAPLAGLLPPRYQWVPATVLLACSLTVEALQRVSSESEAANAVLSVVVAVVLAAQRGMGGGEVKP